MSVEETANYELNSVPDSFSQKDRENVLMLGDFHAMDPRPGERISYIREVCEDINRALERYNSEKIVFNGDTGSADHLGTILNYVEAEEVVFIEGDEDRKIDEEKDYVGWAEILDSREEEIFDTDVSYSLNGEHIRLDNQFDLPGKYPVHVQHFPRECSDSREQNGFESFWFSDNQLYDLYGYAKSPTVKNRVQAAFHSHVHGYNSREIGDTALISLGSLRNNYVTDSDFLPEASLQAVSFGSSDFEIVHEDRETRVLQESQKFRETKDGFRKVKSRGKDHLSPLQRFKWGELPADYLQHLQQIEQNSLKKAV